MASVNRSGALRLGLNLLDLVDWLEGLGMQRNE